MNMVVPHLTIILLALFARTIRAAELLFPVCNNNTVQTKDAAACTSPPKICLRKCCPSKYALKKVRVCSTNNSLNSEDASKEELTAKCTGSVNSSFICTPNKLFSAEYLIRNHGLIKNDADAQLLDKNGGEVKVTSGKCVSLDASVAFKRWFPNGTIEIRANMIAQLDDLQMLDDAHCFDYLENKNKYVVYVWKSKRSENSTTIKKPPLTRTNYVIFSFYILSMISLVVTFAVYALVPKKKNIHEKCLMHQITSLFIGLFLMLIKNVNLSTNLLNRNGCTTVGFCLQFSLLTSFFWLNVMCFDMWFTLGRINKMECRHFVDKSERFVIYCLYAWGFPAMIVLITLCRVYIFDNKDVILDDMCFFRDNDTPRIVHFSGIIVIILVVNLALFVCTAMSMERYFRTRMSTMTESKLMSDKRRLFLYVQMFIVMGCSWFFDFLQTTKDNATLSTVFVSLQGVFVFAIFACKKRILLTVKGRFYPTSLESTTRTTTTTTMSF